MTLKNIGWNIWDDYYDDGFVPQGEVQETHGYVEEFDVLSHEDKTAIGDLILRFIQTLDMTGVEVKHGGHGDISFKHLTHERREKLVTELEQSGLHYNGIPINFYSES